MRRTVGGAMCPKRKQSNSWLNVSKIRFSWLLLRETLSRAECKEPQKLSKSLAWGTYEDVDNFEVLAEAVADNDAAALDEVPQLAVGQLERGQVLGRDGRVQVARFDAWEGGRKNSAVYIAKQDFSHRSTWTIFNKTRKKTPVLKRFISTLSLKIVFLQQTNQLWLCLIIRPVLISRHTNVCFFNFIL